MSVNQIINDVIIFNLGYFIGVIATLVIYKGNDNIKKQRHQPSALSAEQLINIKPPKS